MRYFKIADEGYHDDWGGDPTYWLEVNEAGYAERQINKYPNGNTLSYDKTHTEDDDGALLMDPVLEDDGNDYMDSYEVTKEEFEREWDILSPLNRKA